MPEARSPSTLASFFLASAIALGHAVNLNNGMLRPDAVLFLTVALGLALLGLFASRAARLERWVAPLLPFLFLAGLFAQVGQLFTTYPAMYVRFGRAELLQFYWLLAALGVIGGALAFAPTRLPRRLLLVALVCVHFALGAWLLAHSPQPAIDVDVFHREGIAALFAGVNPYDITFTNIYGHGAFYGPGLVDGNRLLFGYPYPPLSLLLDAAARAVTSDHRWAHLLAMELAAIALAYARPGRLGSWAAALFLTTPRFLFVLEAGWTEPFLVAGAAAVLFAAYRAPRALPWVLGGFLALKQYTVLAVPAALLLTPWPPLPRRALGLFWAKAVGVVALTMLPFFLWAPGPFLHSVVALQFGQPFRNDALSYLAWWTGPGGAPPTVGWAFVAAAVAAGVGLWRAPRSASGFAVVLTLTLFAFVAFNKQAFANYYFLVIGLLCAAAAVAGSERPAVATVSPASPEGPPKTPGRPLGTASATV